MVKVELLKELDNGIRFYSMENESLKIVVVNMGCRIMEIHTPDASGNKSDVILGLKNIEDYADDPAYFGAIIGRVANRIGDARFTLNGKTYELYANNGKNHLHGGKEGFDKKIFDVTPLENGLRFHYFSKDGEEGYPGNLNLYVTYTLNENAFSIHYEADTDADTVVNFTNHLYFNLSNTLDKINDHYLQINSDYIGCVDDTCLATGELLAVKDTPFDFNKRKRIGQDLEADHIQLKNAFGFLAVKDTPFDFNKRKRIGQDLEADHIQLKNAFGYDHSFVLNGTENQLTLEEPVSGRRLIISTTAPVVQVYTGNFLKDGCIGKAGRVYENREGVALETQLMPNAINTEENPSTILRKGDKFESNTKYVFEIM